MHQNTPKTIWKRKRDNLLNDFWGSVQKNMFTDNDKHMQYILVGGLEHGFYFSIQLGIVTPTDFNSIIFQKGWLKPPTSNYY